MECEIWLPEPTFLELGREKRDKGELGEKEEEKNQEKDGGGGGGVSQIGEGGREGYFLFLNLKKKPNVG